MASFLLRMSSFTRIDGPGPLLMAIGGLLTSGCVLAAGLFWGSLTLNTAQEKTETEVVQNVVDYLYANLAQNVHDYALSGDALERLEAGDEAWLDRSIGSFVWTTWNYDYVFVVNAVGQAPWSYVEGQRDHSSTDAILAPGPRSLLIRRLSDAGGPSTAITTIDIGGIPVVMAMAPLRHKALLLGARPNEPHWFLVMGQKLDAELAAHLGSELSIELPMFQVGGSRPGSAGVRLADIDRLPVASISWQPRHPGDDFLIRLGPVMAAALAVLLTSMLVAGGMVGRAGARTHASEERFRDFADIEADWLWETDATLRLTYVSDRHEELLGIQHGGLAGLPCWEFGQGSDATSREDWADFRAQVERGEVIRSFCATSLDARGKLLHLRISARPFYDDAGMFVGYRGTGSNITSEAEAHHRAYFLAHHDALTGLPNRLFLRERLEDDLVRAARSNATLAVLFFDLDHFKKVNDLFGHAAGDTLLQSVAARLREELRAQDTAARLGGDEFVVILPEVGSAEQAVRVADRLVERLAEPYQGTAFEALAGASVGISLYPADGPDAETLMRYADMALYKAKTTGRGRACLFAPEMDEQLQERRELEIELKAAIERQTQLVLHYQPQFDLGTSRLVGFEALVRWMHPSRGLLAPDLFIPLAEETGLIVPLGDWVLRQSCQDARAWPGDLTVAVNLSPAQFKYPRLAAVVEDALDGAGIEPVRLQLEITENVLLKDAASILATLAAIKSRGVQIVLDDFGSGYSCLAYLRQFAFDAIKIDRRYAQELGERSDAFAIISAALSLGQNLGVTVTAEGVETADQFRRLSEMGCRQIQGFHCGRPMPAALVQAALLDHSVGCTLEGWVAMATRLHDVGMEAEAA